MGVGRWVDLLGTLKSKFNIGLAGVTLKDSTGIFDVRNPGDTDYAQIRGQELYLSLNTINFNFDASGAGADRVYSLTRPNTGMSANVEFRLPPTAGSPGYSLTTDGAGVTSWTDVSGGGGAANGLLVDTTTLAFGDTSPVTMFTLAAGSVVHRIEIIIDTAFNGTSPTVSIGIAGTTSKYMAATEVNLKAAAGTIFEVNPGLAAAADALIATYVASSSSAGSARILVFYSIPS
jgi:hypothetical protein